MRKLIFLLLLLTFDYVLAQQVKIVGVNDEVRLTADSYDGPIQWQKSLNGTSWNNISGQVSGQLVEVVTQLPVFYRLIVSKPGCDEPHISESIKFIDQSLVKYWSAASTWAPSAKPQAGSIVTIPEGEYIVLDEHTPSLGGLTINGVLDFAQQDINLTSKWIMLHGTLKIGSSVTPYHHKAIITLNDTDQNASIMDMGTRGIMVMGGRLEMFGVGQNPISEKINEHAANGVTLLTMQGDVDWQIGDEIAIAPTDYYLAGNGASQSQKVAITSVNGELVGLSQSLAAFRWGKLQYATSDGLSLTNENLAVPPLQDTESATTPLILDERATVANLTRNIVIQAPDDAAWQTSGFGVHIMVMGPGSFASLDGVEIKRGGQRGRLARYPIHWHQLSYSGSQTLADAYGQFIKNSVINESANRGIVIHGTNGLSIQNNVIFDVRGHGIFTEDAVERRNVFDGNLVMKVRNPTGGSHLKLHEVGEFGSSAFWISNPDNVIINNLAADCQGIGFWLAFPSAPVGLNTSVRADDGLVVQPNRLLFGVFDNNTAHSNRSDGIHIDNAEIDNAGNVQGIQYASTINGRSAQWPLTTLRRFTLSRYKVWKNSDNGIWDRAVWPDNFGIVSADNCGRFFAGSGADGVIERSLVVGTSLNHLMNGSDRPASADFAGGFSSGTPAAFATYHSTFDIRGNIVINFQAVQNERSGVFSTDDYYTRPVEKGQIRNHDNLLIASHPGVKLQAPFTYFTLASALWDPYGIWGPEGNYFVYDIPFLTHGKQKHIVEPGAISGGVSVSGPFYGFEGFVLHGVGDTPPKNQPYFDLMGIQVRRLDNQLNHIATWSVPPAQPQNMLQHMRDFATSPDGVYELTFPWEQNHPTDFQMNVENMLTTDDTQVIAIQFSGNRNAQVVMRSYQYSENYTAVASRQALIESAGATYWQDKPNNLVWVKIRGGFWQFWTNNANEAVPGSDELLYKTTQLRIYDP
jgi:hypothetical protein